MNFWSMVPCSVGNQSQAVLHARQTATNWVTAAAPRLNSLPDILSCDSFHRSQRFMTYLCAYVLGVQKRVSDLLEWEVQQLCTVWCGCWEADSGPLGEQQDSQLFLILFFLKKNYVFMRCVRTYVCMCVWWEACRGQRKALWAVCLSRPLLGFLGSNSDFQACWLAPHQWAACLLRLSL